MIRILLADDYDIFRERVKQILKETPDMVVTGEARNGQEVIEMIDRNDYNFLVLDVVMPGRNGLDILKDIRQKKPKIPILMISIYEEDQYALRSFKEGASGYMTKENVAEELVRAIRQITKGGKYICPSIAARLGTTSKRCSRE